MDGKTLRARLREGGTAYGGLVVSTSPKWLKYIGKTGMDFVFIDTEHVAIDSTTLSWMCYAYRGANLSPIVRIPSPDPYLATKVLDAGADGIMAPYIETPEQVRDLAGAVKLKPVKGKKLAEILAGATMEPALEAYITGANANHMLFINIESMEGIRNLDEILKVPGLDAVVVGPHDLSCSMNIPEQYDNPAFEEAVLDIIRRSRAAGISAGVHFMGDIKRQISWAEQAGLNLVIHSADINLYIQKMKSDLDLMKAHMGAMVSETQISVTI